MKADNRIDTGGLNILKIVGSESKKLNITGAAVENWNNRKEAPPKPLTKPADFIREKTPTPGTSKQLPKKIQTRGNVIRYIYLVLHCQSNLDLFLKYQTKL